MNSYLICFVLNYSETKRAYGNYVYESPGLNFNEVFTELSTYCKENYNTDRVAITNIIKSDY